MATSPPSATPVPAGLTLAPVPRLLWDNLELALQAQIHRLAKDIAVTLGQPEAPLLQSLKRDPVRAYLMESTPAEEDLELPALRCPVLCQATEQPAFLHPCGAPVLWNSATTAKPRCPCHLFAPERPHKWSHLPVLTPFEECDAEGDGEPVSYYRDDAGLVYDATGATVGRWDQETETLTLFTLGA